MRGWKHLLQLSSLGGVGGVGGVVVVGCTLHRPLLLTQNQSTCADWPSLSAPASWLLVGLGKSAAPRRQHEEFSKPGRGPRILRCPRRKLNHPSEPIPLRFHDAAARGSPPPPSDCFATGFFFLLEQDFVTPQNGAQAVFLIPSTALLKSLEILE